MKWKWAKLFPVVLLLMGVGIGMVSLYEASVAGFMRQMGLVGADFRTTVVKEKIEGLARGMETEAKCDLVSKVKGSIEYMAGSPKRRESLAFVLGKERLKCGVRMLANEKVNEGTYEIVKGIGYASQGYELLREQVKTQPEKCEEIPGDEFEKTVNEVLAATTGKIFQVLDFEWQKTLEKRSLLQESCFAERE
ncbi:MAG: hypothetical protein ABII80_01595 [bacterium]